MKIGFDNDKYLAMQSEHIRERIKKFDNKLYLEFGGKLYDDYHASRVLPGFEPDSKLRMLMQLADQVEIVIVISAEDIEKNKVRGDLGITYEGHAGKPSVKGFRRAMVRCGVTPRETAMLGDKLLTDMLGANRAGVLPLMVEPLGGPRGAWNKVLHGLQRPWKAASLKKHPER